MVNLFPEIVPEGGKEPAFLNRAPGMTLIQTVGTGPIRGLWAVFPIKFFSEGADLDLAKALYVVSGNEVYELASLTAAPVLLGSVTGTGPVSIADNGSQVFFACNPDGFIYDRATGTFAPITDPDFPGAGTVGFLDGYFVFNEPQSQKVWVSELLDGGSIDPLSFASAEGSPDGLVAVFIDHREAWLFGTNSVEVWYDSGDLDFPLTRIQGAFNEFGCAATYSIAKLDNTIFWLGKDARGLGVVYRANGYTGQRVSTHAVEWQIQQYGDLSDAIAYSYQQDGHSFYVLTFPSADATWVYDVSTQAWHERAGFNNGSFTRHRSNCQANFDNETVLGDYQNGNLYKFDLDVYADNGSIQKWLRSWRALPTGENNLKRTAQHTLQLDAETGVGLNLYPAYVAQNLTTQDAKDLVTESGLLITTTAYSAAPGYNPQAMLRWSDDGGHTWSNEHWSSMGRIGVYKTRTFWRRLGMTMKLRDRVYELSGTDPVKIAIVGAHIAIDPTNA
jgi:hypothetical protein